MYNFLLNFVNSLPLFLCFLLAILYYTLVGMLFFYIVLIPNIIGNKKEDITTKGLGWFCIFMSVIFATGVFTLGKGTLVIGFYISLFILCIGFLECLWGLYILKDTQEQKQRKEKALITFFIALLIFAFGYHCGVDSLNADKAYKYLRNNLDEYGQLLDEKADKTYNFKGEKVNWLRLGVDSLLINEVYNGKYKLMLFSIMDEE